MLRIPVVSDLIIRLNNRIAYRTNRRKLRISIVAFAEWESDCREVEETRSHGGWSTDTLTNLFFPHSLLLFRLSRLTESASSRRRGICHTSIGVRIDILRERETEATFGAATIEGFRGEDR